MEKIKDVCDSRAEALNILAGERKYLRNRLFFPAGTQTILEELPELPFIRLVLIYVRDAELGLPEKGV